MMKIVGESLAVAGLALAMLGVVVTPAPAGHPNALWYVVHDLCGKDMWLSGRPAPCMAVDRARGFAVVPVLRAATEVLIVPTARLKGIESPELLREGGVNYWQAAWDSRRYFERRARRPVPREDIAMAINSVSSRSQSQLHIHVDCVRADVRAALAASAGDLGVGWTTLRLPPFGAAFHARLIEGAELGDRDPFILLARGIPGARETMGRYSVAVVPVTLPGGGPGFALLADGGPHAFAEILLDHRCSVLRER